MHNDPVNLDVLRGRGAEPFESHGKPYLLLRTRRDHWEVYRVEGGLARQFGASGTRDGAVGIAGNDASGASAEAASRFFAAIDARADGVPQGVKDIVGSAGLAHWHTGGGCMAWGKEMGDGTHVLLCTEDNDIGGNPDERVWTVGRYGEEGFAYLERPMTLAEAVDALPRLPSPYDANGEPAELACDTLAEIEAAVASRAAAVSATKARMGHPDALKAVSRDEGGVLTEIALIGPGAPQSGDGWAVVTHEGCDPGDPTRGCSGVEPYDTLEEAESAWRDAARGLAHAGPRP